MKRIVCVVAVVVPVITLLSFMVFCTSPTNPYNKPRDLIYDPNPVCFTVGIAVNPPLVPTCQGAGINLFSISPVLSDSLMFDKFTGKISGVPKYTMAQKHFTVTATNSYGSTTTDLAISIVPPKPENLTYKTYFPHI